MDAWLGELRHALRRLAQRPAFTLVAVAMLALGIGGATAIFSVADAVILRPLPFADPARLVLLWQSDRQRNQPFVEMSYPAFREWRTASHVFEELSGMPSTNQGFVMTGLGEPVALAGRWVTTSFFEVLGARAALGRVLLPEDDRPGALRVVVLGHALWRERFAADSRILGRVLTLNNQPFTVVGVMPPDFAYPKGAQLWTPLLPAAGALAERAEVMWMSALGRLKAGVSLAQARRELDGSVERYNREQFKSEGHAAVVTPLAEALFGPTQPALLALLVAVGVVLLISCANVAGLLLIHTSERSTEMAVRLALGASLLRLSRAVFTESVLLAGLGGLAGAVAAAAAIPLLVTLAPQDVPRLHQAALDSRTLGFGLLVSLAAAGLAGSAPVPLLRKASLEGALRERARSLASGRSRLRSGLVVLEVALAVVLLVGAGLLTRSFRALRTAPLGFEPDGLLALEVALPELRYPETRHWRAFYQQLLPRVQAIAGVEAAAVVALRPLWGTVGLDWPFALEGQSPAEAERNPLLNMEAVSADYFRTMGMPLKRGRAFTETDVEGQPGVVVVSESLARRSWPGQDPIGKRLKLPLPGTPYDDAWLSVVGVVGDARYRELRATRLDLYMSYLQANHRLQHLVLRTRGEPALAVAAVRTAVHAIDPDQPVEDVTTMSRVVSEALGVPRFASSVFAGFALVALLLAALGLYGLLASALARRTREIGVRVALGARPRDVAELVLREGLGPTLAGIAIGLVAALAGARLLEGLLYGVRPVDARSLALAPILLLGVALVACGLPLRRALRVDPAVSLRFE